MPTAEQVREPSTESLRISVSAPSIPLYLPLLLSLPAWIPLAVHALRAWSAGLVPTAFVQYDTPYYLASGRQFFANGFHWAYSNPYASYDSPAIYFQPQLFIVGALLRLGLSPDLVQLAFGVVASAFAAIMAAKLYEEWAGWSTTAQKLGLVCFFWGGGALALLGAAFGAIGHTGMLRSFLLFDAGDGWWMLNFGRNLVYPTEAYYHGLFLLAILLLLRRKFGWALAAAALLSASHPFTGLSLALLLTVYCALEVALRSGAASWRLLVGSAALTLAHLGYYIVFLNRFADHRSLQGQWTSGWIYPFWVFVPALYLVGILALGRLTHWKHLAPVLAQPRMRLCLVWFAVIFALTQHDLVIPPMQPIHFAHGYDWMALFLLATPALLQILEKLLSIPTALPRAAAVGAFLLLVLSDNILWFTTFSDRAVQSQGIALTRDQKDVLLWLRDHAAERSYVATQDRWIGYLTATYTNVRSWVGHDFNTPRIAQRRGEIQAAFEGGIALPTSNPVYYVLTNGLHGAPPAGTERVYADGSYTVWFHDVELAAGTR